MLKEPQNRHQSSIFNSIEDLVSNNSYVRIIDKFVDLFLTSEPKFLLKGQSHTGRPAYPSTILFKILLYGYLNRITTSRRLEAEAHRNIELIWLIGGLKPDHKTISDFKTSNSELIKEFSIKFKQFLLASKLIDGGLIAIDGTKLKANASRANMVFYDDIIEKIKKLDVGLIVYIQEMEILDAQDTTNEEIFKAKSELEVKFAQQQLEIDALKLQLKTMESMNRKSLSLTDPDCRIMQSSEGKIPAYNVQIASDSLNHFIVNDEVTNFETDYSLLATPLQNITDKLGLKVEKLCADSGYYDAYQIQKIEETLGTECFVNVKGKGNVKGGVTFIFYKDLNKYVCSQGQDLVQVGKYYKKRKFMVANYRGKNCKNCPIMAQCTKSKRGRGITRYLNQDFRDNYKTKMQEDESLKILNKRKSFIEHINGTIKVWAGKIPLHLRGIEKVANEVKLYCTAYNVRRLLNLCSYDKIMQLLEAY